MNELTIKTFTTSRFQNMRNCDQSYYKFSADWAQPQPQAACKSAIADVGRKLALVAKQPTWGSKTDTPELIAALASLVKSVKLGSDDQQNSFVCYQLERYFFRIWFRGTKEQREAIEPKTAVAPKVEKEQKAPAAPKTRKAKKETKETKETKEQEAPAAPKTKSAPKKETGSTKPAAKKSEKKPVAVKTVVVKNDVVEPEVIEVEAPNAVTATVMDALVDFLRTELTAKQQTQLVSALAVALKTDC